MAGAGDEEGLGWPGRLTAAAWAADLPLTSYNLGVRGESTSEVARRFRAEAEPRLIPGADNRVLFAVGANDVSLGEDGEQAIPTEESVELMTPTFFHPFDAAKLMNAWVWLVVEFDEEKTKLPGFGWSPGDKS